MVLCDVATSIGTASEKWPYKNEDLSPIVFINEDWESSQGNLLVYLNKLEGLDYGKMIEESEQKDSKKVLENRVYYPHITFKLLSEKCDMYYRHLKIVLDSFIETSRSYGCYGKWKITQSTEYMRICNNIIRLWKKRINELLIHYGYSEIDFDNLSSKERPDNIIKLFTSKFDCDEFFDTKNIKKNNVSQWGSKAEQYRKGKKLILNYGDAKKLYDYIIEEYPEIETKCGFSTFKQKLSKIRD